MKFRAEAILNLESVKKKLKTRFRHWLQGKGEKEAEKLEFEQPEIEKPKGEFPNWLK